MSHVRRKCFRLFQETTDEPSSEPLKLRRTFTLKGLFLFHEVELMKVLVVVKKKNDLYKR